MAIMWTLVLFDLPVATRADRRHATRFRTFLQHEGYIMLQFSVYVRPGVGLEIDETSLRRLKGHLPPQGNVRMLQLTDRQMGRMQLLVGTPRSPEKYAAEQLVLL
ncbi:MAG: CRISPR-associated endonuclease Cas2 [Rhodospirillales bacterium]|nr:CRISPR-associated endonuclease Cas2 [Rhodospirillales bacterium]